MPREETLELIRPAYNRLDDYLGAWSMEEVRFDGLRDVIMRADLTEHINASIDERKSRKARDASTGHSEHFSADEQVEAGSGLPYQVAPGGIAVIELRGTLMKSESSFTESTSTVAAKHAIRLAARDPNVAAIALLIDSPGGTVAGTSDLAAEVAAAASIKPVAAHIEDLGASAAYWVASQADTISTNPTGLVGSIGTFMTVRDTSAMAEKAGMKVHVVKAGDHKGAGTPGTAITDDHLAEFKRMVTDLNSQFVNDALVKGRKMSPEQAATVADGRVHVGEQAKAIGLVDAVQSFEATIQQLVDRTGANSKLKKGQSMTERKSASLAELKAAFPKSTADWREKQMEAGATLAEATTSFADFLQAQIDSKDEQLKAKDDELAKAKAAGGKKSGVEPFTSNSREGGSAETTYDDPRAEFNALKNALTGAPGSRADLCAKFPALSASLQKGGMDPLRAGAEIARRYPQLHSAYLVAINSKEQAQMELRDRSKGLKV